MAHQQGRGNACIPPSHKGPGNGPLTSSFAHNSEKNASNGVISVEHRRLRHRHRQRHGGTLNDGKKNQRAVTFATPMAISKLATDAWIPGVIFILDNLVGTPQMGRTTLMARTTRLARMAGMGRLSAELLNPQVTLQFFFASQ